MTDVVTDVSHPFLKLQKWLQEANLIYAKKKLDNYNAAVLTTVSAESQPSSRVILIKDVNDKSLVFFTNLNSKKAKEISKNNKISLLFHWELLKKQVRVEGIAELIQDSEADNYFATRPYLSKIGAWASKQSDKMDSRSDLEKRVLKYAVQYQLNVPRPEFWSGFRITPNYFEFWKAVNFRLHKRTSYTKTKEGFKKAWLYP